MIFPLLVLLALPVPSLLGACATPFWSAAVCLVIAVALGLLGTANGPANYDMHGFARDLGLAAAVVSAAVWIVARSVRFWLTSRTANHSSDSPRQPRGV
jgi:hypothetical protein